MTGRVLLTSLTLAASVLAAQSPTTRPADPAATQMAEPALLKELEALQTKLASIQDFTTEFTQEKHTPLLRKPLISSGQIRMAGQVMRWDTTKPAPSSMLITDKTIELFYPKQKLLEVYPIDDQLGRLAASPVPRIDMMQQHFSFARLPAGDVDPSATDDRFLGVELLPKQETLKEHIDHVRLLVDRQSGYLRSMEMVDSDGDRTVIRFAQVRMNTGINPADLKLDLPKGTRISKPLSPENQGE